MFRIVARVASAVWVHYCLLGLANGWTVDPSTRFASLSFYQQAYLPSANVAMDWTGSHAECIAGTTAVAFREAVIDRVNYFRAMAGAPAEVSLREDWSAQAQQAALMMSANNNISHQPPPNWLCYTSEGAAAAGSSNLAVGRTGPSAVDAYMKEPGASNSAAGHRRWILYPQTDEMGTGNVPRMGLFSQANALWVLDGNSLSAPRPSTRDPVVAWPPPGYVPYQVTYPRWSISIPSANFSAATVTMTEDDAPVSVSLEPVAGGYGENTLVWIAKGLNHTANWPRPSSDTEYRVTVDNVIIAGAPQSISYTVTVFDPSAILQSGDYNQNGVVDAADYLVWRNTLGQTGASLAADGNASGVIDAGDYDVWRANFGRPATTGDAADHLSSHAVVSAPEPASLMLILAGVPVAIGACAPRWAMRRSARRSTNVHPAT
jgi:uncharacterized protein YkwD